MADVKYSEFTAALDTVTPTTSDNIVINDDSDSGLPKAATMPSIKTLFEDLTTKGDLLVYSTEQTRLPVGTDDYVLTADSSEATGLKWAAASGGGLTYSGIAPTTANVTLTEDYKYTVDASGLTANRNLVLPSPRAAGKEIQITIDTSGTYYCVLIGDTGVTINNGSASTEYMRMRHAQQSIRFISTSTSNWDVVYNESKRVLIDAITLSSAAGSVSFSNIPQQFKHLELYVSARTDRAGTGDGVKTTFNTDTTANYYSNRPSINHSASLTTAEQLGTNNMVAITVTGDTSPTGSFGVGIATITGYSNTSKIKLMRVYGQGFLNTTTGNFYQRDGNGAWNKTDAITSIELSPELGSNFKAGSDFLLYGIT